MVASICHKVLTKGFWDILDWWTRDSVWKANWGSINIKSAFNIYDFYKKTWDVHACVAFWLGSDLRVQFYSTCKNGRVNILMVNIFSKLVCLILFYHWVQKDLFSLRNKIFWQKSFVWNLTMLKFLSASGMNDNSSVCISLCF